MAKDSGKLLTNREREEALALEEHLSRDILTRSFSDFVQESWRIIEPRAAYVHGWHIDAISEHLEALLAGTIRDLVINVPPRHMKSSLISVLFPAWVWIRIPEEQWLYASYGASLSKRDSIKCRRIIESQWYKAKFKPDWILAGDQNEKMRFDNTRQGYRLATSVGGAATGEGGSWIVVDDPHNAKEIHSKTKREAVISWWDEVMSSRGNDPKTVRKLIVMQRLHAEDLTGHVMELGGYEHLVLPAEYDCKPRAMSTGWEDPRTEEGELLWPERFGKTEITKLKIALGSLAAAGQLQQNPRPPEGNIIKREWVKFWKQLPDRLDERWISWDLTNKGEVDSDFSVGQVWGRKASSYYLIDQVRARLQFPGEVSAFRTLCAKHPGLNGKLVEEKANGFALLQLLKKEIPGLIPFKPRTSKGERLAAVSPIFEAGNVYFPDPSIAPWVHDNIEELVGFPNEKHDDTVDATTQILIRFLSGIAGKFESRMSTVGGTVSGSIKSRDTW